MTIINALHDHPKRADISAEALTKLKKTLPILVKDVLGLREESRPDDDTLAKVMELVIEFRDKARQERDFETSDLIRDRLLQANIALKDGKEGTTFSINPATKSG